MSDPIFKSGEELRVDGVHVKFLRDIVPGAMSSPDDVEIDGQQPKRGDVMPLGLLQEARRRMPK